MGECVIIIFFKIHCIIHRNQIAPRITLIFIFHYSILYGAIFHYIVLDSFIFLLFFMTQVIQPGLNYVQNYFKSKGMVS